MKKQQNPKRASQKFFKFLIFLLFLQLSTAAGAMELLDRAASLEREGKSEDARDLYIQWLSKSESSQSERFGRILIHTLRMPAPLEEDLGLIQKHLHRVQSAEDKKDITRTALILSELSGQRELVKQYLASYGTLNARKDDITIARLTLTNDLKYESLAALKDNAESPNLLLWIDRVHKQYPSLITEADWLFQLQKILEDSGFSSQAKIFRDRILKNFPFSVEASLINKQVSPLSDPEELYANAEDSDTIDLPAFSNSADDTEELITYYQAGAFQDGENASSLSVELEKAGLLSHIRKDGASYKVIIESRNDDRTMGILKEMGIQAFRIPRLP